MKQSAMQEKKALLTIGLAELPAAGAASAQTEIGKRPVLPEMVNAPCVARKPSRRHRRPSLVDKRGGRVEWAQSQVYVLHCSL